MLIGFVSQYRSFHEANEESVHRTPKRKRGKTWRMTVVMSALGMQSVRKPRERSLGHPTRIGCYGLRCTCAYTVLGCG